MAAHYEFIKAYASKALNKVMKDEWFKKEFAEKWDIDTERGNPTRPKQLDILVNLFRASEEINTRGVSERKRHYSFIRANKRIV